MSFYKYYVLKWVNEVNGVVAMSYC